MPGVCSGKRRTQGESTEPRNLRKQLRAGTEPSLIKVKKEEAVED